MQSNTIPGSASPSSGNRRQTLEPIQASAQVSASLPQSDSSANREVAAASTESQSTIEKAPTSASGMLAQTALKKPSSKASLALTDSFPKQAFLAQATAWAAQAVPGSDERRDIALRRIKDALDPPLSDLFINAFGKAGREFNFSGCHLTSLPEIPDFVGDLEDEPTLGLDLSYNRFTILPNITGLKNLITLDLYGNRLQALPDLSGMSKLTTLNLAMNQFTELPGIYLPKNLRNLILSNNPLTALPDLSAISQLNRLELINNRVNILPNLSNLKNLQELDLSANRFIDMMALLTLSKFKNLKILRLRDNQLSAIPDISNLSELIFLDLSGNQLTDLSGMRLPKNLQSLMLSDNSLSTCSDLSGIRDLERLELANNLLSVSPNVSGMRNLQILDLSHNQLTAVSDLSELRQLQELDLSSNQLTHISEEWLHFPEHTEIHIEDNPISPRIWEQLYEQTSALNYQGPAFFFSMASNDMAARPVDQAVAEWYPDPSQTTAKDWSHIAQEANANNFSILLDRLRTTVNFTRPEFKQQVVDWLERIYSDAELRKEIFLEAQEGLGSCEDRVSFTFNTMKKRELELKTARGDYDSDLPQLVAIARQQFRLDELEKISYQKTKTLRMVDEIEVYLAYQVKLYKALQLDLPSQQMRFFQVSGVTEHDLQIARLQVQQNEQQNFLSYLAEWSPWQAMLRRLAPEDYLQAEDQRSELASTEFDMRLHQLLEQQDLENNEFNRTQYKDKVLQDISRETFQRLTENFLQQQKLSHLLSKSTMPWSATIDASASGLKQTSRPTVQRSHPSPTRGSTSAIEPDRPAGTRARHPVAQTTQQPAHIERRSFAQRFTQGLRNIFSRRRNN